MDSPRIVAADNFLVPNATFIAELVAFLIILTVLWKYVLPPIQKAMGERQEIIRKQIEDSERASERLAEAETQYQQALAESRVEAAKIRETARAEADRIVQESRTRAEQEAELVRQRAEEQLATQRQQVVNELRSEIGRLAVTLAERIVGESLEDDARSRGTVDRFLTELDEMAGSTEEAGAAPSGRGKRS